MLLREDPDVTMEVHNLDVAHYIFAAQKAHCDKLEKLLRDVRDTDYGDSGAHWNTSIAKLIDESGLLRPK